MHGGGGNGGNGDTISILVYLLLIIFYLFIYYFDFYLLMFNCTLRGQSRNYHENHHDHKFKTALTYLLIHNFIRTKHISKIIFSLEATSFQTKERKRDYKQVLVLQTHVGEKSEPQLYTCTALYNFSFRKWCHVFVILLMYMCVNPAGTSQCRLGSNKLSQMKITLTFITNFDRIVVTFVGTHNLTDRVCGYHHYPPVIPFL